MEGKKMEQKTSRPRIQVPALMKRSSSSSLSYEESPHSPLRFHSPLWSDQGDPPDTPPYSSPINSPLPEGSPDPKPPPPAPVSYSPALSPLPPLAPTKAAAPPSPAVTMVARAEGTPSTSSVRKVGPERPGATAVASILRRSKREELVGVAELGIRVSEMIFSLISFSVMAADKTQGWSGDSFDRYTEYRYCLSVNVIAFVYSAFQAYDLGYYVATGKHAIRHHLYRHFSFLIDQILAYLLISASSSAATRVTDWESNWGKDEFTEMATASVAMSFLAFFAFAASSIISGYHLYNNSAS